MRELTAQNPNISDMTEIINFTLEEDFRVTYCPCLTGINPERPVELSRDNSAHCGESGYCLICSV